MQRVFYLKLPVTIPANGSTEISAAMLKKPSFDFACSGSVKVGIRGYDMLTQLGSELKFNKLTAELLNADNVEIIDQNFGFDLLGGITKVNLDLLKEHYYIDIKRLTVK